MANSKISFETQRFISEEAQAFSDLNETTETMTRKSLTESDAVHPRFVKENPEEVIRFQTENMYYCGQCKLFFAPTVDGLKEHFNKKRVDHRPYGSCFYCKGSVYDYSINNKQKLYHNCKDEDDSG